jgi:hypothetical protein
MYQYVGMMIGHYRKKAFDETKLPLYNQNHFIQNKNSNICSQSKLSLIENGKVLVPYPEEYVGLINKLDRHFFEYEQVMDLYEDFVSQLLNAIQYQTLVELKQLEHRFNIELSKYSSFFYLSEVNRIIEATFNVLLDRSLIDTKHTSDLLEMSHCFPDTIRILIYNLAFIVVENYTDQTLAHLLMVKVDKFKSNEPIISIFKMNLKVRKAKIISAQRELLKLKELSLSELLKFRIDRLLYVVEVQHVDSVEDALKLQNPADNYLDVNRYEKYKAHMALAYFCYDETNYKEALTHYQKGITLDPEASGFALIFICDCLSELEKIDELNSFLINSKPYLHLFPSITTLIHSFFSSYVDNELGRSNSIDIDDLSNALAQVPLDNPYVLIIRKYIIKYVKRTHSYKLLFDFESKSYTQNVNAK